MTPLETLIVTAASRAYGRSLLALLRSLTLNWPQHPPVLVNDIGLDEKTHNTLRRHNISVKPVPQFCPHWRRHFTWKPWAWNDAPATNILWIDAGIVVLRPLDDILAIIRQHGYFLVPNGHPLAVEASEAACRGCHVPPDFPAGKPSIASSLIGFRKQGPVAAVLQAALQTALTEAHIEATDPRHRHEQALISLLFHRDLAPLHLADPDIYLRDKSPRQFPGQPVWIHRRNLNPACAARFSAHLSKSGTPYLPYPPAWWLPYLPWRLWHRWQSAFAPASIYDGVRV